MRQHRWLIAASVLLWASPGVAQTAGPEANDLSELSTTPPGSGGSGADGGESAAPPGSEVATPEAGAESPAAAATPDEGDIEEARLLFLAAERAFADERYQDAITSFQRSYTLTGDPQLLYNIAVARERLELDEQAIEAFRTYLELQPETSDRRDIELRIIALEARVAEREPAALSEPEPPPVVVAPAGPAPEHPEDGDGPTVFGRWWFWTAIAVVVGGAVAVAVTVAASGDPEPVSGSEGVVIEALSW